MSNSLLKGKSLRRNSNVTFQIGYIADSDELFVST